MPNFEINLTSTNQAAIAPARQYLDLLKQITAEAAKVDKTWAQTATRTATSHRRSGQTAAQEAKKAADQMAKEAKRAADQVAREAKRSADARIREDQRAGQNADRWVAREYRGRVDAERRKQGAIEATAARQERESSRAAQNAEKWVGREYRDRVRFEQQKQREADRATRAAEKSAQREAAAIAREAKKAADAKIREDQRAAQNAEKWVGREYRDRVRFEQRKQREADRATRAAEKSAQREAAAIERANQKAGAFATTLQNVAGTFLGFVGFQAILNEIGGSFERAQNAAVNAAKFVGEYREALLELAALKGRLGETGPELQENLQFRAQTLQTREAATAFQLTALGAGEAGIDKGGVEKSISEDEFKKLMVLVGSMQAAEGGAAETYGALAGQVPMLMGRHTTGEESFRKIGQFYNILKPGGSTFSGGVEQFLKNAPYAQLFEDPAQMMALQSAFSIKNRGGAGEQVEQFMRATVGGLGRMRGVQVEGDSEKIGEYLKNIGATDQMTPVDIGKRVAADFAQQRTASAAKGEKFNPMSYLLHHGYGNQEDRMALMAFSDLMSSGVYEKTFEPLTQAMPTAAEAMQPIRRFQGADPAALNRGAELALELAKVNVGVGPREYAEQMYKVAFAQMKSEPGSGITGEYEDVMSPNSWNPFDWNRQMQVRDRAAGNLMTEARRVGVEPGIGVGEIAGALGPEGHAAMMYRLSARVGERGGDILPGMAELLTQMQATTSSVNALTKQIADAQQVAAAGVGPGGANVAPPPVQPPRQPPGWRDRP